MTSKVTHLKLLKLIVVELVDHDREHGGLELARLTELLEAGEYGAVHGGRRGGVALEPRVCEGLLRGVTILPIVWRTHKEYEVGNRKKGELLHELHD